MSNSRQNKTDVGNSACEIAWGAEEARKMDEMIERCTGHPCAGSVGGSCPVMPRALSSIAKQHADPRAAIAYAEQQAPRRQWTEIQAIFDTLDEARQHELADLAAQLMEAQRLAKV